VSNPGQKSNLSASSSSAITLSQRSVNIELLLLDVDGVLTDGGIVYADNGTELKKFHVRDGSGLKLWHMAGKKSAIISGRTSRAVEVRAAELGIGSLIQGAADKRAAFGQVLVETGVKPEQVASVGDDVPDLPLLAQCGLAIAVADACSEVLANAHYITRAPGGRGAVREAIELILRCQDHWQKLVEQVVGKRD
jgi:3-deoxy-D-manno-octulosonate 8-phosphate phosphatase (KDO 8-P phosphatase)